MEEKRILIVEDDAQQLNLIEEELSFAFQNTKIEHIRTESEFYSKLDEIVAAPPDLILMDMMLRWTVPAPPEEMPPMPEEVAEEGYYRAGIRCAKKLLEQKPNKEIPLLVFTVLHQDDIDEDLNDSEASIHLAYLRKTAPIQTLLKEITRIAPAFEQYMT